MFLRCVSYNCNSIRNNKEIVQNILNNSDILFLQELMLHKTDLGILNEFHKDFDNVAYVNDMDNEGIKEGRPSAGGCNILEASVIWFYISNCCR